MDKLYRILVAIKAPSGETHYNHGVLLLGFAVIVLLVGLWNFICGAVEYREAQDTLNFASAQGKIVTSRKYFSQTSSGSGYDSVVKYSYTVGGKEYSGHTVSFRTAPTLPRDIAQFPLGTPVTVYYDPSNPAKACLQKGQTGENIASMVMAGFYGVAGVVFLLIGMIVVFLQKRRISKQS